VRKYTSDDLKKLKSKTDVDKFESTSEKDILEQIIADPDTPHLTDVELNEFDWPERRKK
jgi:uncharacterized protein (UPF0147 family)